jgi:pimeloyl-ACP methyl ester carboxylesterase
MRLTLRISTENFLRKLPLYCSLILASQMQMVSQTQLFSQSPPSFRVTLSPEVTEQAIDGRLYVFITSNTQKPPVQGPAWFNPEPFVGMEVRNFAPGGAIILDDAADGFPGPISQWPAGNYRVQALLDHDFYYPVPAMGPGNFTSQVLQWNPAEQSQIDLVLDQIIPEFEYTDSQRVKFIQQNSRLLSAHFGFPVIDRAAVILPASYDDQPDRRYPVIYEVTGFGGSLRAMARGPSPRRASSDDDVEFIQVMLTGECKYGHHVYANSPTNGPRGDALVEEMIPAIDALFRTIAEPPARFVSGHSSGGWSSLWLQINYPDTFGGVFSTSPDPVDFRDFQGTNLYADPPQSVYVDPAGMRRPLARRGQDILLWYDDFCRMDQVLGRGGQMRSFDAVFSPLGQDGTPERCWDPATGQVNPRIAEYWRQYDISLLLAERWEHLKDSLAGKIHIIMGDKDTFYLEGATHLLAQRLNDLNSDASVQFIPDAGHSLPASAFQQLRQRMNEKFLAVYNINGIKK